MKLTKRNIDVLLAIHHGVSLRVRGRAGRSAVTRMNRRLQLAGLITWIDGERALTIAGRNAVADEEARVAKLAEREGA